MGMLSLPPSIAPRSVPLTMVPPPQRASRTALVLVAAAWVVVGLLVAFRSELGDEFHRVESWRSTLRRAALGASGLLALASLVPAVGGIRRAPLQSALALAMAVGWIALMVSRVMG
jgi:hypothetical protein